MGVTITHCGPTRTTWVQITTRTAGERQTWVTFEKGRVAGSLPLWQTRALLAFPHLFSSNIPAKPRDMALKPVIWQSLCAALTSYDSPNFSHTTVTVILIANRGRGVFGASSRREVCFREASESSKVWHPCLGAGGIVANSFWIRERNWESRTGKISCLMGLNLCSYARGRVTPGFVNSGMVHFFWAQTRKLGPTQMLPYGNCLEMASSRQFPSSHHRAMEMQQKLWPPPKCSIKDMHSGLLKKNKRERKRKPTKPQIH